jgi:acetyltransferase
MPPELRVRALQPGDAGRVQDFVRQLSARSRVDRYFAPVRELSARQLERVTRGGHPRDVALAAFVADRLVAIAECAEGEFAVVVADDWQGLGLGEMLMQRLLTHAQERSLPSLYGVVRERNRPMLRLASRLGFRIAHDEDPGFMRVERALIGL